MLMLMTATFQVGDYKRKCAVGEGLTELCGACPPQFLDLATMIHALKFYDPPDYEKAYSLLRQAMVTGKVQEFPYDWEEKRK